LPDVALSEGSKLVLYAAEDMLMYKSVSSISDYTELQHDINTVINSWWCH